MKAFFLCTAEKTEFGFTSPGRVIWFWSLADFMEAFEYEVLMDRKGTVSDGPRYMIHLNPRVGLTDWHNHPVFMRWRQKMQQNLIKNLLILNDWISAILFSPTLFAYSYILQALCNVRGWQSSRLMWSYETKACWAVIAKEQKNKTQSIFFHDILVCFDKAFKMASLMCSKALCLVIMWFVMIIIRNCFNVWKLHNISLVLCNVMTTIVMFGFSLFWWIW